MRDLEAEKEVVAGKAVQAPAPAEKPAPNPEVEVESDPVVMEMLAMLKPLYERDDALIKIVLMEAMNSTASTALP